MYTLRNLVGTKASKELISNIESCSLAEDAPAPRVGGIDVQTSYESWSAGSMRWKQGNGMGSTVFQRRAESHWAELVGSMMSRVLKRREQAEEGRDAQSKGIRIRYCRV